jgi:hypothetical protein
MSYLLHYLEEEEKEEEGCFTTYTLITTIKKTYVLRTLQCKQIILYKLEIIPSGSCKTQEFK